MMTTKAATTTPMMTPILLSDDDDGLDEPGSSAIYIQRVMYNFTIQLYGIIPLDTFIALAQIKIIATPSVTWKRGLLCKNVRSLFGIFTV